jgi:hypothetical protein
MHNTPIGPTGAAIEKPMASPLSRKVMYIYSPVTNATIGKRTTLWPPVDGKMLMGGAK